MTIDWDDLPLTPWEQEVIARIEDDFGRHDPGMPGRVGRGPGPPLFIGAAVAVIGTVLAFGIPTQTPLALSGYILLLVGLVIVWNRL
jgi:hypothetical protein